MNTIHQISLKLQMGIHPAAPIQPEALRAMWRRQLHDRIEALQAKTANRDRESGRPTNFRPVTHQTG